MNHASKFLLFIALIFLWFSASFAGKIRLEPSQWEFISRCPFTIDVMMDMEWVESNTVWISFFIDDSVFALNEFDSVWWMFPAYTSFVRGKARHGEYKWRETISVMWTTAQKKWVSWKGKFVTLKILPLLWTKSMKLDFYTIPGFLADDSNINYASGDKIYDALIESIWWSYTFVEGECPTYENPIPISEDTPVILKTQENKTFFWHQMPFFSKIWTWLISHIQYVFIMLLILTIVILLFVKKHKHNSEDKK